LRTHAGASAELPRVYETRHDVRRGAEDSTHHRERRYPNRMSTATAGLLRQRASHSVVRFYKMDHLGDPVPLRNGRIRLGVQDCKRMLRAGIKQPELDGRDTLVIAIGGVRARDGLADRLCWAGIPVERFPDGCIDLDDGFYLAERGPLEWRQRFPRAAAYVDTVKQGHRVWAIPLDVRDEFIDMLQWGRQVESRMGRSPVAATATARCPPSPCPPRRRRGC